MNNFKEHWDNTHTRRLNHKIRYDNWLDNYQDVLKKCNTEVLDLGCGSGNDTLYLIERGFKVLSCDYSEIALNKVKQEIPNSKTIQLDISQKMPFKNSSFDLIIADLSLHYFDEITTFNIMEELKNILTTGGYLLARVNSTADINHGAGQGEKIEENFYYVEGYNKRFFTIDDANKFFSKIGNVEIKEAEMLRYSKPKQLLEIKVQKSGR